MKRLVEPGVILLQFQVARWAPPRSRNVASLLIVENVSTGLFAHWNQDLAVAVRLLIAAVLAGIVGWERETQGRSAGLRTHMLVGAGAALFVGVAGMVMDTFPQQPPLLRFDPTRIIQGVILGIGFLGGGIIFVDRSEHRIRGLTTAASIWTTTGIGLTVGLGRYLLAALATVLVFLILHTLRGLEPNPKEHSDTTPGIEG